MRRTYSVLSIARRHAVLFSALLAASHAHSLTIGAHTWSRHESATHENTRSDGVVEQERYNNQNFGGYVILDSGVIVGAYRNSYWRNTVYAGYTHHFSSIGPVTPVLTAALATGYQRVHGVGRIRPMFMPSLVVATPIGISLRYSAAPSKGGAVQHLSIERKF